MSATLFEEHSSVLAHWAGLGVEHATVVYLDAHLDLQHVDAARIERLRQGRRTGTLRALEAVHPFACIDHACFGIEDFLYPAAQLGLIERIVWVAPPHVLRAGLGGSLGRLVQMEGVTLEDIESFDTHEDGSVRGRLLGVELIVCALAQLDRVDLPPQWLLDIDVDYFVALPENQLGMDPLATMARLRALPNSPQHVTISRSVGTGFTPLRLRFLGELLADLWMAQGTGISPYERVLQAHGQLSAGKRAACRTLCADLVAEQPGLAAASFLAGLCADSALDAGQSFRAAAQADPAYCDDVPLAIAGAHSRKLRIDRASLERWQRGLSQADTLAAEKASPAWVMLGLLYSAAGMMVLARDADDRATGMGNAHPELALEMANAFLALRDVGAARHYLPRALSHGSTRARAYTCAAHADELGSDMQGARAWLDKAAQAQTANPAIFELLARVCRAAGDPTGSAAAAQHAQALAMRLGRVARRLDASTA